MIREYNRQIKKTEGFYAPKLPLGILFFDDNITEVTPDNQKVIAAAAFAVKAHNINEAGRAFGCGHHADLELERVVRANSVWLHGTVYSLTLQASDKAFYEAKVRMCPVANSPDFIPELQRAKHYKE
ncbi:Proteinase inhibitor I25, cystatin, conserved region [Parasponia andersonii]|uniref:Proteinase inhibitor I25, cystatin, conserved region n=1 Tax=Parasponia andersonii TaxID=3476 RepID=A0A2P5B4J2_PARAD|nr:Proteinase inhibitor I25, cystatin, conserved region [Parasponia andersonii]